MKDTHFAPEGGCCTELYNVRKCRACEKTIVTVTNSYLGKHTEKRETKLLSWGLTRLPVFEADDLCDGDCDES